LFSLLLFQEVAMRKGTEHFLVPVKSVDELPPPVCEAIRAVQPDSGIHQIVLIPPQEYPVFRVGWLRNLPFGWRKTPKRTLVFGDDQITLVEESPLDGLSTILIPYASLIDLHLCTVLLYAYMELHWASEAQIETLKIEFTLVGLRHIRQGLEHVRTRMLHTPPEPTAGEISPLEGLPLKFRNFTRSSLLPGETVHAAIFQPAVRREVSLFHPLIAPNCAAVITDYHLIFIQEEVSGACREYATNVRFYPLSRICQSEVKAGAEISALHLLVGMGETVREVAVLMSQSNAETLCAALKQVEYGKERDY